MGSIGGLAGSGWAKTSERVGGPLSLHLRFRSESTPQKLYFHPNFDWAQITTDHWCQVKKYCLLSNALQLILAPVTGAKDVQEASREGSAKEQSNFEVQAGAGFSRNLLYLSKYYIYNVKCVQEGRQGPGRIFSHFWQTLLQPFPIDPIP
eukprot:349892-Pelagomonas_calceolata.AAC.3